MENIREHNRQRAPMYSDDELMTQLEEWHGDIIPTIFANKLLLVERLLTRATETIGVPTEDALDGAIRETLEDNAIGQIIGNVSCQVTREILNGKDAHTITIEVLKYLRNYKWGEKMMFTLTAFAVTFGDFWLLVRNYANNAVNESMTADKREPTTVNKDAYKIQIEANNDFIKSLVNTIQWLFKVRDLPFNYVVEIFGTEEGPYKHTSGNSVVVQFSVFVYWIMRCAIVAATQIIILSSRGLDQYLVGIQNPNEFDKLKSLNEKLGHKISDFESRMDKWRKIPRDLSNHDDIVQMMKSFIRSPEEDSHALYPLYHSVSNRKDNLDVLNGKRVLLLISGLNIDSEDITNLKHVNIDSERDVIVWIPILKGLISGSDDVKNQLETLQNLMPWYSIHQPSLIEEGVIEAFRIHWDFKDKPILVVLSPEADVLNDNAIFMVRIWQNLPVNNLTSRMEQQLWENETWNLKLLVNGIDQIIQEWIRDGRYILMYGSNDIDWIRTFIRHAHSIACNMLVHIETVYVGNSHNKVDGCKVQDVIMTEQLSHCLAESSKAYFWSRINSMIESKEKVGEMDDPTDKLLQEILKFNSHEEWVLLANGSAIIGHGQGRIAMTALEDIEKWMTMSLK